jgi:hypothetical protein
MVLTPEGKIARYFYGIEYKPRDFRLGLVEASANKIGTPADQVLLFCYHYDPMTGKYGMAITQVTRALGTATVLALGRLRVYHAPAGPASHDRTPGGPPSLCSFHFGPKPLPRSPSMSITYTST